MRGIFSLLLVLLFGTGTAQAGDPDIGTIVRKIDQLYRSSSSYAELEMHIVTPHWQRTLSLIAWTEGTKKTFIRIQAPLKDRNVATLRIGADMWNYLPAVNKVIKIPPSMMAGSWMGSDFTNDDLVKESSMLDDYDYRRITPADALPGVVYIEFTPKENKPIVWARIVSAVRLADTLPLEEKYYDEKGALLRVLTFTDIRQFNGRSIPSTMELIPRNKPGNKTTIHYRKLRFDIPVGPDVFTLRALRSKEQ